MASSVRFSYTAPDFEPSNARTDIILSMARGWESKSVEEQQSEALASRDSTKMSIPPADIARQRQRQGLLLSRQRVLQQLEIAKSPRHREILQNSLADLDAQLARLG